MEKIYKISEVVRLLQEKALFQGIERGIPTELAIIHTLEFIGWFKEGYKNGDAQQLTKAAEGKIFWGEGTLCFTEAGYEKLSTEVAKLPESNGYRRYMDDCLKELIKKVKEHCVEELGVDDPVSIAAQKDLDEMELEKEREKAWRDKISLKAKDKIEELLFLDKAKIEAEEEEFCLGKLKMSAIIEGSLAIAEENINNEQAIPNSLRNVLKNFGVNTNSKIFDEFMADFDGFQDWENICVDFGVLLLKEVANLENHRYQQVIFEDLRLKACEDEESALNDILYELEGRVQTKLVSSIENGLYTRF